MLTGGSDADGNVGGKTSQGTDGQQAIGGKASQDVHDHGRNHRHHGYDGERLRPHPR